MRLSSGGRRLSLTKRVSVLAYLPSQKSLNRSGVSSV